MACAGRQQKEEQVGKQSYVAMSIDETPTKWTNIIPTRPRIVFPDPHATSQRPMMAYINATGILCFIHVSRGSSPHKTPAGSNQPGLCNRLLWGFEYEKAQNPPMSSRSEKSESLVVSSGFLFLNSDSFASTETHGLNDSTHNRNVTSTQSKPTDLEIRPLSPCSVIVTHGCRLLATWLTLLLMFRFRTPDVSNVFLPTCNLPFACLLSLFDWGERLASP